MSFHDEQPSWLYSAVVHAAQNAGIDGLVAVAGPYAAYKEANPDTNIRATPAETAAIKDACDGNLIPLLMHTGQVWHGNEVEKRTAMFQLAETMTTEDDWYIVIDADEFITEAPDDLKNRLAIDPDHDVAEVTMYQTRDDERDIVSASWPIRIMFRAIRGLKVEKAHYVYTTPDGRYLWGNPTVETLEPALDMTDLRIRHLTHWRPDERRLAARRYYKRRDDERLEVHTCFQCSGSARRNLPVNFRMEDGLPVSDAAVVCDGCAEHVEAKSRAECAAIGLDYDNLKPQSFQSS